MKQIIQDIKSGRTVLEEVPVPQVRAGYVLVKTSRSLVSLGTERMLVEFGKANLIDKARQQPDKVKQVLDKIKTDGLQPTLEAVFNKLGQPLPLGYCNVGRVVAVGKGVAEFKVDDRVVSNGNQKISCAYFISSWISGRKSDTEYNLEGKMAAENMGIGIFSEYISLLIKLCNAITFRITYPIAKNGCFVF